MIPIIIVRRKDQGRTGNAGSKRGVIEEIIRRHAPLIIAFSGGVDSTLLAVIARGVPGIRSRCVFIDSPLVPRAAAAEVKAVAEDLGLDLIIVHNDLMLIPGIKENPADRCRLCKDHIARVLAGYAGDNGFSYVADGANLSDTTEHRPGIAAATARGVLHPFIEVGVTKEEIRAIARRLKVPAWDRPSSACLATRIPYGEEITAQKLRMIEKAEVFLAGRGFLNVRVRVHGTVARIETDKGELPKLLDMRDDVVKALKKAGFRYVAVDLEGYRSGSMDEVLKNA